MALMNIGLQMARTALAAQQLALEVTGNNIANANNETYARRRVNLTSMPDVRVGNNLYLGTGVGVGSIQRVVDSYLDERVRQANADSSSFSLQRQTFDRLEGLYNELGDNDLSSMMNQFFSAISDLRNYPDQPAQRQLVVSLAENLTEQFRAVRGSIDTARESLNQQFEAGVASVNSLASQIASVNDEIVRAEGGGTSSGSAASLRDQRDDLLARLSDLVTVSVTEQNTGAVDVRIGSHALVTGNQSFALRTETAADFDRGTGEWLETADGSGSRLPLKYAVFEIDGSELQSEGGTLHGYIYSRDQILAAQSDKLDALVSSFSWEFNKLHSEGCGTDFFSDIRSVEAVSDADAALTAAGLDHAPVNGGFSIRVHDLVTGLVKTVNVQVDLDGIGADDSLNTLAAKINAAMTAAGAGVSATVNSDNTLSLSSASPDTQFSFSDDTSHVLAALGINTFFTGTDARTIGVNALVKDNVNLVAAGLSPVSQDSSNAARLADLKTQAVDALGGLSMEDYYQAMISDLGIEAALTKSRGDGADAYLQTLSTERQTISGVNVDEEAMNVMRYQRAFQAAARYVSVIDEMMQTLLTLVQ